MNKILSHIDGKHVDWRLIKMKPRHDLDRNLNNDQMLKSCKLIGIKIVGG